MGDAANEKAPVVKSWFKGLKAEFKKIIWPDKETLVKQTIAVIIITGVLGNMFGEIICKVFKITEPISKGLAYGASAHAIGTAKAIEIGEVEGAMSGLAIAVSGIFTVALASLFANFI